MKNHPTTVVAGVLFFLAALIIIFIIRDYLKSQRKNKDEIGATSEQQESWKEKDDRRKEVRKVLCSWGIPAKAATALAKADLTPQQVKDMSEDELKKVPGILTHWAKKVLERTQNIPFEPEAPLEPLPIPDRLPLLSQLPMSEVDLKGKSLYWWFSTNWWLDHLLAGSFGKRGHFPADFFIMSEQELDRFLKDYRFLYDGRRGKLSARRIEHIKEIVRRTKEGNNR